MHDVVVIQAGYSACEEGAYKANGTITLINGPVKIIVDTGSPCQADRDIILKGLSAHGLSPSDIDYVVGTHGHVDHIGNLGMFPAQSSTFIIGFDIYKNGCYIDNELNKGESYKLGDLIEILPTPGHTCHDVSVVVRHTTQGTVVVAGDLFECEDDLADSDLWKTNSHNPAMQETNRARILQIADVIIPGHGHQFTVNKNHL